MAGQVQKRNYQRELDQVIAGLAKDGRRPRLLLHSCCAPCSSYVLEYLSQHFQITLFYYNPNIYPAGEYEERIMEQERLIGQMEAAGGPGGQMEAAGGPGGQMEAAGGLGGQMEAAGGLGGPVELLRGVYAPEDFYRAVKGRETDREGGEACFRCYELRLRETAKKAAENGFDYFTTTLSISPLKNAEKLGDIGERLAREYGVPWLVSDFKKKNGYKRSTELSARYGLYRQDYCGCVYSLKERQSQKNDLLT